MSWSRFGREKLWPAFLVGCGRSGTTILGTVLGQHPDVLFLNEPRRIWRDAYPITDIWTENAARNGGRLVLTWADADRKNSRKLERVFRTELRKAGRSLLLEKLPANSFRLPFLDAIFPQARFIHLWRDGREVARSIARRAAEERWYGSGQYRWHELEKTAGSDPALAQALQLCESGFERGLLEWRMNEERIRGFLRKLPQTKWIRLSYGQLVDDPGEAISRVTTLLALKPYAPLRDFARSHVARKTLQPTLGRISDQERRIGGELLEETS